MFNTENTCLVDQMKVVYVNLLMLIVYLLFHTSMLCIYYQQEPINTFLPLQCPLRRQYISFVDWHISLLSTMWEFWCMEIQPCFFSLLEYMYSLSREWGSYWAYSRGQVIKTVTAKTHKNRGSLFAEYHHPSTYMRVIVLNATFNNISALLHLWFYTVL